MVYYCSTSDAGQRLGLNSAQRASAATRLDSSIRRASIDIDQEFRDYGRDTPSRETGETTLDGAHAADGVVVQQGEMAHVLREVCADLAAAYYMEDEGTFFTGGEALRGSTLRDRGTLNLRRLAHLGSVD